MNTTPSPRLRSPLLIVPLCLAVLAALAFIGLRHSQAQGSPTPTTPAPLYGEAQVNVSSLNVRTGPHVSYTAIAYLVGGEQVRLVGRNRAATWAQIELYNGYRGWVNARYLQAGSDIAALPVADVALIGITAFVTNDPIAVFVGPNARFQRVGVARPGDVLAVNGRNDAATWVHVYLPDGRAGWMAADGPFLPSKTLNDLPIITPFLDAPPPEQSAYYLVYAGPGFLYEPFEAVAEGQTLGIRGRTADNRWVLVRLPDGREGWIAADIIRLDGSLDGVPVIDGNAPPLVVGWQATSAAGATSGAGGTPAPTPSATPTTRPTETAAPPTPTQVPPTETALPVTATPSPEPSPTETNTPAPTAVPDTAAPAPTAPTGVYVYPSPSDDAPPILRVVPGQSVTLVGRTADAAWVKVRLPGNQEGWLRAAMLQAEIDLSALPVVSP